MNRGEWLEEGLRVSGLGLVGIWEARREVEESHGITRVRTRLEGNAVWADSAEGPVYARFTVPKISRVHELQLAQWDRILHSYCPEVRVAEALRGRRQRFIGPVVAVESGEGFLLVGYEHGTDAPDSFIEVEVEDDEVVLRGTKANFLPGEPLPWTSPPVFAGWFSSLDAAWDALRGFLWSGPALAPSTRRPWVTYNTWNRQERGKYLEGRPYLHGLGTEWVLREIEAAHALGVEVFVIDTGWYGRTGEWRVDENRFPDGLQEIRSSLDEKGMRLGLWFDPLKAARSSAACREHPEWRMSWQGEPAPFHPVWETEESTNMCLCTPWADHFGSELIRLCREVGVTYFKWDGVGQYGCDAPGHGHGDSRHSPKERSDRSAFLMCQRFEDICAQVLAEVPEAIFDFDATEKGRVMGLGFLRHGRFFHINNGPYFSTFDLPSDHARTPDTINVFFNASPARARVCRTGAEYDRFVPSSLFMAHSIPDGDRLAQENALASFALGGQSLWGDLCGLSPEDAAFWSEGIARFKEVRDAAARVPSVRRGRTGASPEVHEKIDTASAEGCVSIFTATQGEFVHLTQPLAAEPARVVGADHWEALPDGRLQLTLRLGQNGARLITIHSKVRPSPLSLKGP